MFTGLTTETTSFICSLNGVSKYLNVNPAQKLLELIKSFSGESYLNDVKSHIQKLLDELGGKIKYDEIIQIVQSLDCSYNQNSGNGCKSFINNSLDIKMIKHMIEVLENNKSQSAKISEIESNVRKITSLKDAPKTLTNEVANLKEFVKLQENTKFWIDQFSSYGQFRTLVQFSNELKDSISLSYRLMSYIELSNKLLNDPVYDDYMIRVINSIYKPRFQEISSIINNFKVYVRQTSNIVGIINSNLSRLKSFQCYISVGNNLWMLKEYVKYLKVYVMNIRISLNVISAVIDKIKAESPQIDTYKKQLESLEKYIDCYVDYIVCYIVWILCINDDVLKESVVKHLGEIKDRLNDLISVMTVIDKFKCLECINKIKCKLESVESGVCELECTIDGVIRNLTGCSLLSSINNIRDTETNNNNINSNNKVIEDNTTTNNKALNLWCIY